MKNTECERRSTKRSILELSEGLFGRPVFEVMCILGKSALTTDGIQSCSSISRRLASLMAGNSILISNFINIYYETLVTLEVVISS
jgi:hypothetical protein